VKIAVLVLVLANLVLFAWLRWGEDAASHEPLVPVAQTARRVVLLSERPTTLAKPGTATTPPPETFSAPALASVTTRHAQDKSQCIIWGPIATTTAKRLAVELKKSGGSLQAFARPSEVPVAYRVELTGFSSLSAARRVEAAIRKGGITDLYLLDKFDVNHLVLSLGLFHERPGARQRAIQARKLGFRPAIHVITRKRARHFLQLRLPAARSVLAALRQRGVGDESRHTACVPPSAADSMPVEASAP
jgi:hypothetical protein